MRRRYLLLALSVAVVLSLLVTPLAFAKPPAPNPVKITVVSTNDFHGALVGRVHSWSHGDVVGGSEWVAGYINIIRDENPDGVLLLDAGDIMQGTLISNYFGGASTIEVYNALGYDAVAIGNHEFDFGRPVLYDRMDQAEFPFLAANIFYPPEQGKSTTRRKMERPEWALPSVMIEKKGVQIAVIGFANPETPSLTNPINVSDLLFAEHAKFVMKEASDLREQGADLVIVLAHVGGFWPLDKKEDNVAALAQALDPDKVDVIVSGHTHSDLRDVVNGIPIIQAYSSGTAFARVDFTIDTTTGQVVNYEMNPYPTTTYQTYFGDPAAYRRWDTGQWVTVVPDPEVEAIVDYYEALVEAIKNEVIGCANSDITRNYRYESEMGDWVTDIMRAYDPGIDFAFTNSGGLRADIDAGPITFGEVFEALPFDNTLVVVDLDGNEVRQVLEEGITGAHGVVQVSGLQFTFDYDASVGSRIIGDVIDLSTGLPLDPGTIYKVAVNDFMAYGGDEYDTLVANPQTNTYVLVRDIVVDWVKAAGCFDPPNPAVEQRITALGTPPS